VAGIGDQGQGVGPQAGHDFHSGKSQGEQQGPAKSVVAMIVRVGVPVMLVARMMVVNAHDFAQPE
jgi:hypothetical protein